MTTSPVMRRRLLGSRLRDIREAAGKSLEDVAAYLECSSAKISRIETGRIAARVPDVRSMSELYAVPPDIRSELLDLVRDARQRPWWHDYAEHIPESLSTLIGLTEDAHTIDTYASYVIPGLLQTRGYAQAVAAEREGFSPEEYARFIELRIARQRILTRDDPPTARFLLDEALLRRPMDEATVRRDQIARLLDLTERPNVTIQVIPLRAGLTAAMGLSFSVLSFHQPGQTPIAHVDLMTGGHLVQRPSEVRHYEDVLIALAGTALDPVESGTFLRELVDHGDNPYHGLGPD
jgi:transcriptional regulator with XRE-family HTH domain